MRITKVVRGVLVLALMIGTICWNMQSRKAVALAPVKAGIVAVNPEKLWSDNLHLEKTAPATGTAVTETGSERATQQVQKSKKERKKEKQREKKRLKKLRMKKKKQRQKAARKKHLAVIKKKCGITVSSKGIAILERIVEAEAGDQGHRGKRLVANVIINRVKSSKFPSTIKGVVFAPRQFSPVTDGAYARAVVTKDTKKAVDEALHGVDYSKGALYFMDRKYADSSNIRWFDTSLTRLFQYNGHEFYK
jgi:N-acetylmuramoyl-L-alanine amidase